MSDNNEKNYMLVQEGCGACDYAKDSLKDPIGQNKIILLDTGSKKGIELVNKHEVDTVPTIINEKDNFQQKCYLNKDGTKMFCDDGTEKNLIKEI